LNLKLLKDSFLLSLQGKKDIVITTINEYTAVGPIMRLNKYDLLLGDKLLNLTNSIASGLVYECPLLQFMVPYNEMESYNEKNLFTNGLKFYSFLYHIVSDTKYENKNVPINVGSSEINDILYEEYSIEKLREYLESSTTKGNEIYEDIKKYRIMLSEDDGFGTRFQDLPIGENVFEGNYAHPVLDPIHLAMHLTKPGGTSYRNSTIPKKIKEYINSPTSETSILLQLFSRFKLLKYTIYKRKYTKSVSDFSLYPLEENKEQKIDKLNLSFSTPVTKITRMMNPNEFLIVYMKNPVYHNTIHRWKKEYPELTFEDFVQAEGWSNACFDTADFLFDTLGTTQGPLSANEIIWYELYHGGEVHCLIVIKKEGEVTIVQMLDGFLKVNKYDDDTFNKLWSSDPRLLVMYSVKEPIKKIVSHKRSLKEQIIDIVPVMEVTMKV